MLIIRSLILSLMLLVASFQVSADSFSRVVARVAPSTVTVLSDVEMSTGVGSGVIVGRLVLTAAHVINGIGSKGGALKAETYAGDLLEVEKIGADEGTDVGVLRFKHAGYPHGARFREAPAVLAERVFMIGAPYGAKRTLAVGYVSNPAETTSHYHKDAPVTIQLDITVLPGFSGSGIFDEKGRLLGIMSYDFEQPVRAGPFLARVPAGIGFALNLDVVERGKRVAWEQHDYPGARKW